jgi:phenylpyruvate tautomerase PptA (4-oxalocrotonate tautomerase family)
MPLVQIKGVGGSLTLSQNQEVIRKVTGSVVSVESKRHR